MENDVHNKGLLTNIAANGKIMAHFIFIYMLVIDTWQESNRNCSHILYIK